MCSPHFPRGQTLQASGVRLGAGWSLVSGPSRLILLLPKCSQTQECKTHPDLHVQLVHNSWPPIALAWIK